MSSSALTHTALSTHARWQAYNLVQKHGSLEGVLANLDKDKYPVPDPYPYEEARRLFRGAPLDTGLRRAQDQPYRPACARPDIWHVSES